VTLDAIDAAVQPGDDVLEDRARLAAHQLGEVAALLQAGITLGAAGADSLRAAEARLGRFVADLCDLDAQVDRARWERLGLSALVGAAFDQVRTLPSGDRLELRVAEELPAVAGDRGPLLVALAHLLRFCGSAACRGPVRVDVGAVRRGDRIDVTVAGDRAALDPAQAARLFAADQVPPGRGPLVGAGVGLVAARLIIAAHGGAISALPGAGGGALLTFDLPARP